MQEFHAGGLSAIHHPAVPGLRAPDWLSPEQTACVRRVHEALPMYEPTRLVRLDALAGKLGIRALFVKDESARFGLNAFKGLGGIYALFRVVCRELALDPQAVRFTDLMKPELQARIRSMVFVTATDGNHGKGVAWAAGLLGCEAHVYMPAGSSEHRRLAIEQAGRAEVRILDAGYDDAVRYAARMARENGWQLVQDTSQPGYEEVPAWIIQGYTTMALEAADQLRLAGFDAPTHVFLQAGVGSMAGGVLGCLAHLYAPGKPSFAIVEPDSMACVYRSAQAGDGLPHPAGGAGNTIMAGLNCGEVCGLIWPVLRDLADWYITCPDRVTEEGMRLLAHPLGSDCPVVSGESGAVTTGLAAALCADPACAALRDAMGLGPESVVLVFSTEGNTDPESYDRIVNG